MTEAKMLVDIDNFLEEHRRKLIEDKKVLNDILNFLQEKQQAFVLENDNYQRDSRLDETGGGKSLDRVENYPYSLSNLYKDEYPRVMVRYGEFSPLNPVFRSTSRPLLGLGEYEERRKIFLEKKKREYQEYLSKAKNEKERERAKSKLHDSNKKDENHPRLTNIAEVDSAKTSPKSSNMPREVLSPGRGIVEATDRCYSWWQQQVYRRELDRQILDKKKRMKEEKERERLECEKKQKELMMEQIKLSKSIAEQIRRYQMTEMLDHSGLTEGKENQANDNDIFINEIHLPDPTSTPICSLGFNPVPKLLESPPHRITSSIFTTATRSKSPDNVLHRITSPIFNAAPDHSRRPTPFHVDIIPRDEPDSSQSPVKNNTLESVTESAAESSDRPKPTTNGSSSRTVPERKLSTQKSQQEIYKNELARQIEEKKRLEMERKRKEAEEDRRIDEKVRLDEEKLRQEFEKEQAERAYRATRRVQHEVRHQEQISKFQKEAEERKKNIRPVNNVIGSSKPSVYPTNHFSQKGGTKNVSFASKASVYSFQNTNDCVQSNDTSSTENHTEDASQIILDAPYILAVKGNEVNNNSDGYKRPRSPPVPAIRTQQILSETAPKTDTIIPSTVSMSPQTKEKFLKDANILTNLSEIRRRLLLKHAGLDNK